MRKFITMTIEVETDCTDDEFLDSAVLSCLCGQEFNHACDEQNLECEFNIIAIKTDSSEIRMSLLSQML